MKWLEISISVDGELAEPIAELFTRYAPGGVVIETPPPAPHLSNLPTRHTVKAFLPWDESLDVRRAALETGLWHLGRIRPLPAPDFQSVDSKGWEDAWRKHYHPLAIGESLLILPPWVELETGGRHPVIIEPGMAFGTGTHPSTQLCLVLLETHLQPGEVVLDLGCGSGILSIAAVHLGASQVFAVDTDPEAVRITLENATRNQVGDAIVADTGSLESVHGLLSAHAIPSPHLIVANILAHILEELLAAGLGDLLAENGRLILSGILDEQLQTLLASAGARDLNVLEILEQDDWRAVILTRK